MFSLTVVFGTPATPLTLLYHTEDAAKKAWQGSNVGDMLYFADEFGQQASIARTSIHGVLLEDMDKSALVKVEMGLHNMRTQIKANSAGKADPAIAAHLRTQQQQGPGMITPGGLNGRF